MQASLIKLPFATDFGKVTDVPVILEEIGRKSATEGGDSASPIFWLNSGGRMITVNGRGNTIQGDLLPTDKWYQIYHKTPGSDAYVNSDGGLHPQNLFRLYTRQKFLDTSCSAIFRMNKYHLSDASERKESNGLLVMSRATPDGADAYYGGVRVDGTTVIKRKKGGIYSPNLLAKKIFPGTYDRAGGNGSPNLIPLGAWIGIKLVTKTLPNGHVQLSLFTDMFWTGIWSLAGTVEDSNPILHDGLHALRTDFADVTFDALRILAA